VWLPVVADGIASNIGTGATDEQAQALAAATSGAIRVLLHHIPATVPAGLWCYRVDRNRSLLGGAVNDVGRMASWLSQTLRLPGYLDLSAAPGHGADRAAPVHRDPRRPRPSRRAHRRRGERRLDRCQQGRRGAPLHRRRRRWPAGRVHRSR
jgi:sugar (pentulose or hexulose) kinase